MGLLTPTHDHVWGIATVTTGPEDQVGKTISCCLICFDTRGTWERLVPGEDEPAYRRFRPPHVHDGTDVCHVDCPRHEWGHRVFGECTMGVPEKALHPGEDLPSTVLVSEIKRQLDEQERKQSPESGGPPLPEEYLKRARSFQLDVERMPPGSGPGYRLNGLNRTQNAIEVENNALLAIAGFLEQMRICDHGVRGFCGSCYLTLREIR